MKAGINVLIMNLPIDVKVAGIAAKKAGIPRIVYRRGSAIPIKNKAFNRYLFGKVITDIIANSEATKETVLENNKNLFPIDKIKVIYNGLDIQNRPEIKTKSIYKREQNEIILGNAGRMVYQKGHEYLLELASRLKAQGLKFKLLLAGTGPLEKDIILKVEKYGLKDHVVFLGFVENIAGFMSSIDIFILTSRWEGFGFVLAEAMFESKPCVAFNLSSNPELVIDGVNGYLVQPFDIDSLMLKTLELAQSEELRKKFGEQGKLMAYKKFTFDRSVAEIKEFLKPEKKVPIQ